MEVQKSNNFFQGG